MSYSANNKSKLAPLLYTNLDIAIELLFTNNNDRIKARIISETDKTFKKRLIALSKKRISNALYTYYANRPENRLRAQQGIFMHPQAVRHLLRAVTLSKKSHYKRRAHSNRPESP